MKRQRVFFRRLRRFFITTIIGGLVVVLPFTLLVLIIRFVVNFITGLLEPVKQLLRFPENVNDWLVDLVAFAIVISIFFIVGLVVRTELGDRLFRRLEEQWLAQLPFYLTLRETVRQFLGRDNMPFSEVVLVDAFNNGSLMTGFVTENLGEGWYTIFVPTAPNPTNGFVFHVPAERLRFLEVKPEEAMRSIIGMGTGSDVLFDPARLKYGPSRRRGTGKREGEK